ncbi:MAG: twin-arginine translocase subunit TatC [Alphaproteobacteria bacterium]
MTETQDDKSLTSHLIELRRRLLWSLMAMAVRTAICFVFVQEYLRRSGAAARGLDGEGDSHRLIYTGLTEAFFTYVKVAFFSGIFLTFPILLTQIWRFVAPGLYKNEKRAVLPFLVMTPLLFS